MKFITVIICSIIIAATVTSGTAEAFWGSDGGAESGLNLDTGYDANTVVTMTGRIAVIQVGDDRRMAQLELENSGGRTVILLGPRRYWAENGIALKTGENVTVRGSKAQGKDGVVYVLAQKITDATQNNSTALRNESGRPLWAGNGMGGGAGKMNNRPAQMPGRMGTGRMGR